MVALGDDRPVLVEQVHKDRQAGLDFLLRLPDEHQFKPLALPDRRIGQPVAQQDDPVLRADDPIFHIAGAADSGVGDLSTHHDRYLYRKDWQEQPPRGAAG